MSRERQNLPISRIDRRTNNEQDAFYSWTVEDVGQWLAENDFGQYRQSFELNSITGDLLLDLNYSSLKEIGVVVVGDRARILQAIKRLLANGGRSVSTSSLSTNRRAENRSDTLDNENFGGRLSTEDDDNSHSASTLRLNKHSGERSDRRERKHSDEKSLHIFPRTSSRKESIKNSTASSHQDLFDAVDSVFGKSAVSTPSLSALSPTSPIIPKPKILADRGTKPSKPFRSQPDLSDIDKTNGDIMQMKHVREMKTEALQPQQPEREISSGQNKKNLQRFFGVDPLSTASKSADPKDEFKRFFGFEAPENSKPKDIPTKNDSRRRYSRKSTSKRSKSPKKLLNFFGERPPDEMIVDQLEKFFPGINTNNLLEPVESVQLKDTLLKNIKEKRSSNRVSSLMLRKRNGSVDIAKLSILPLPPKPVKKSFPTILEVEDQTPEVNVSSNIENKEKFISGKITFRWAPGRIIGQGAFGKVFHALNLDTGEFMAVKQVLSGGNIHKKSFESLQREIELLQILDHENIVRYLGYESKDETFNVFLEYISGGSISSCLAKCGKFPEDITRSFTGQILCGLEYLHYKSIIHRDIKGANVLITGDGVVKISDFGISKTNEKSAYNRMTRMSMQGSVYWMAPEVAKSNKGYSAKVDIWSLGCLVLEMLTGHNPWHNVGGNIIYKLGHGQAPPIPPGLSKMSTDLLNTTFIIDPEKRPTASELLNDEFTDIDPSTVDFVQWSQKAMQHRAEAGSTSEEETTGSDGVESDGEGEDEYNDEDELGQLELGEFNPTEKEFQMTYSGGEMLNDGQDSYDWSNE